MRHLFIALPILLGFAVASAQESAPLTPLHMSITGYMRVLEYVTLKKDFQDSAITKITSSSTDSRVNFRNPDSTCVRVPFKTTFGINGNGAAQVIDNSDLGIPPVAGCSMAIQQAIYPSNIQDSVAGVKAVLDATRTQLKLPDYEITKIKVSSMNRAKIEMNKIDGECKAFVFVISYSGSGAAQAALDPRVMVGCDQPIQIDPGNGSGRPM